MTVPTTRRYASRRELVLPCAVMAIALLACKKDKYGKDQAAEGSAAAPSAAAHSAKPCPGKFRELPEANGAPPGTSITCQCASGELRGSVWGSGTYTTDSRICVAAVHAGAITPAGGTVKMKTAPGCPGYVGSAANGVSTSQWGSYQASFYFEGKGDGK